MVASCTEEAPSPVCIPPVELPWHYVADANTDSAIAATGKVVFEEDVDGTAYLQISYTRDGVEYVVTYEVTP